MARPGTRIAKTSTLPRHPSLSKMHARAAELGWRCHSTEWVGREASYEFECDSGHRFTRRGDKIFRESARCAECVSETIRTRWLAIVAERGGTLLGTFTRATQRYRLRCAKGHEWEALGTSISNAGHWCLLCRNEQFSERYIKAEGLTRLQTLAQEKGGCCLADAYTGGTTYYPFQCACGHRWEAQGRKIVDGAWCPECAKRKRGARVKEKLTYADGLQRLQEAARRRGGECLATEYVGGRDSRYPFRCAAGHEWMATSFNIWQGNWCRRCSRIALRTPIEKLQAIAAERGGRCLSPQCEGKSVKLTWECERGHVWQASPTSILQGRWCHQCPHDRKRDTLEMMQQIAAERGGRCLSEEYAGSGVKLAWECHRGHVWRTTPEVIKRGAWCRNCVWLDMTKNRMKRKRHDFEG